MAARSALSTDFWSSMRSLEVSFFCCACQCPAPVIHCLRLTYLGLLALLEERVLAGLAGGLVLGKVAVLADLVQNLGVDALEINLGGGSDNVSCVYPSQRNAVDFEGAGDEEDTLGQVLEEDDTLAAEATSEENDDGAGLQRGPGFRGADGLASLGSQSAVFLGAIAALRASSSRIMKMQPHRQSPSSCVVAAASR